ncbi:hypothetical protein KUCAC02_012781, partial [Chaenocephalus aceratus]
MAGRQAPRRTSLNWDESDTDEDKEEIDKVKAKLGEKLQAKECTPNVRRELVSRSYQIFLQNMLQIGQKAGITSGDNFQRSFLEWTYCRHEIDKLLGDDHFSCPACGDDMVAVSLDGNRKMYRFNRQGAVECPYFEGTFIAKDTDVEGFVQRIRDKVKPAPGRPSCGKSNFKTGRKATRKSEARLDEEGMMTSVCRHCILFSGLTVGEEVEAVNSYLSRVATTTKYMSKARRTDMITIHARGWNLRKKQNLHRYLSSTICEDNNKDRKPKRDIIAKNKRKLEEAIAVYNNLVPDTEAVDTADAVLSQDFPIWPWDSVPLETKKMAFDKVMLLSRLREEDGILIKEMKNHCRYLTGSSRAVQREIQQIEKNLCKQSLQEMEKQKEEALQHIQ